ncbi:MAG: hypothetical protein IKG69_08515 [Atopobiaceae bacterium]|nr:hypothetical protein [Atopobiaceae bacterium]
MGGRGSSSRTMSAAANRRLTQREAFERQDRAERGETERRSYDRHTLMNAVEDRLRHRLPDGATWLNVTDIGEVDSNGYVDVDYAIRYETPYTDVDADGIEHTYYDRELAYEMQRVNVSDLI